MARRRDRFVVGFHGDGQCLYGPDDEDGNTQYIQATLLSEARQRVLELGGPPGTARAIYRLELVEKHVV